MRSSFWTMGSWLLPSISTRHQLGGEWQDTHTVFPCLCWHVAGGLLPSKSWKEIPTVRSPGWSDPEELDEPTVVPTFIWRRCIQAPRQISATLKKANCVQSYLTTVPICKRILYVAPLLQGWPSCRVGVLPNGEGLATVSLIPGLPFKRGLGSPSAKEC